VQFPQMELLVPGFLRIVNLDRYVNMLQIFLFPRLEELVVGTHFLEQLFRAGTLSRALHLN